MNAFVRARKPQRKDLAKIRQDLKIKGISISLVEHYLEEASVSVHEYLARVYSNKYRLSL